ncbi:hypothetical protein BH11ARM2_BH11ARM2_37770 [soil metagenome]
MTPVRKPPRLHLLPAKEAPTCVVVARMRAKVWHILDWDLRNGMIYAGSWFQGQLYPMRCDVSWDGRYMAYLATDYARPHSESCWNGLCQPPRLKTFVDFPNIGSYNGGGVFTRRGTLAWNTIHGTGKGVTPGSTPFRFEDLGSPLGGDLTVLLPRLKRDGWSLDEATEVWSHRPTKKHPELQTRYAGFFSHDSRKGRHPAGRHGYPFEFSLEGRPDLLPPSTEWATWDANGDLLWAEAGLLHRTHPEDLFKGKGPFQSLDLNGLEPLPPREKTPETPLHLLPGDQEWFWAREE